MSLWAKMLIHSRSDMMRLASSTCILNKKDSFSCSEISGRFLDSSFLVTCFGKWRGHESNSSSQVIYTLGVCHSVTPRSNMMPSHPGIWRYFPSLTPSQMLIIHKGKPLQPLMFFLESGSKVDCYE